MTASTSVMRDLPPFPELPAAYQAWTAWAKSAVKARDYRVLAVPSVDADPRLPVALRALVGVAVGVEAEPEDVYEAAHRLFKGANEWPTFVIAASAKLLHFAMERAGTTPDILFLAGAFAWPLQHVEPALGNKAWQYLVYAPWQSSSRALKEFCSTALEAGGVGAPRRLLDLALERKRAGLLDSAQELLEGMLALSVGIPDTALVSKSSDLGKLGKVPDIEAAVVALADIYVHRNNHQVHAREVIRKAGEIETVGSHYVEITQSRVWDRPVGEAYDWAESKEMRDLDREVARACEAGQPHHARRLCEAVIARALDKRVVGSAAPNMRRAGTSFAKTELEKVSKKYQVLRAAEHLALLYSRTGYPGAGARALVDKVLKEPMLHGAGSPLAPVVPELQSYLRETSPYGALVRQERLLEQARHHMTDDERRAADASQRWMSDTFLKKDDIAESVVEAVTSPILDLADVVGLSANSVAGIQETGARALTYILEHADVLAGDVEGLAGRGSGIRAEAGAGLQLKDFARGASRLEPIAAGLSSGAIALLPPGFGLLTAAADVAVLLVAAYRVVARVGAVYGIDLRTPRGFEFAADAFTLGCSSKDGEGLLAYLTRSQRAVRRPVTVGSMAYGGMQLAQHLWTATNQPAAKVLQQSISNTATLLGISLTKNEVAKVLPFAGAVVVGLSGYAFVESIRDAALELAAREALLEGRRG